MISLISSIPNPGLLADLTTKARYPSLREAFCYQSVSIFRDSRNPKTSYPFWYFIMCCSKLEHRFNNVYVMSCTAARSASSNYRISRNIPCLLFMTHIFFGVCTIFWLNKTLNCKLYMMRKLFP